MLTIRVPGYVPADPKEPLDHFPLLGDVGRAVRPVATLPDGVADCYPLLPPIPYPDAAVGRLYWPGFGASRFAFAHYLLDQHAVERLKLKLADTESNKVELWFTDGPDETDPPEEPRKFTMYLIEAVPVVKTADTPPDPTKPPPDEQDGYICTFVDLRYYWQFISGGSMVQCDSWEKLYRRFADTLGATVASVTAVDPAYGRPAFVWTADRLAGLPTAPLFDAALSLCNYRLVVDPETEDVSLFAADAGGDDTLLTWHESLVPGGDGEARFRTAGPVDQDALAAATPAEVLIYSLAGGASFVGTVPDVTGDGQVIVDADDAEQSYADQFAADWGRLQTAPLDAVYGGFVVPPVEALSFVGGLLLDHAAHDGTTAVLRPPGNYPQLVRSHGADCTPPEDTPCDPAGGDPPPTPRPTDGTVSVVCGTQLDPPPGPSPLPCTPVPCPTAKVCVTCGDDPCSVCMVGVLIVLPDPKNPCPNVTGGLGGQGGPGGSYWPVNALTGAVVDWGDGVTADVQYSLSDKPPDGACCVPALPAGLDPKASVSYFTVSHTYDTDGTYPIAFRFRYESIEAPAPPCDGVTFATAAVGCGRPKVRTPPDGTFGTTGAATVDGCTVTFTGTVSRTTPTGGVDSVTWAVSWGDGATGSGNPATHTYVLDGTYTISWTATDANGNTSTGSVSVTVAGCAPRVAFTPTWYFALCEACVTITVTAPVSGATLTVDWGDGSASYVTPGDTNILSTCHTYTAGGSYTVSITAVGPGTGNTITQKYVVNVSCTDANDGMGGTGGFGGGSSGGRGDNT